jgi:hypothetical protein
MVTKATTFQATQLLIVTDDAKIQRIQCGKWYKKT